MVEGMSGNSLYDPDQSALDTRWTQPWSEAFRAQRDVGLRTPINFHTIPAVSLSQACFAGHQYEHNAFRKCFSNLLGVGFRRFTVDAYWDALQSVWSLCPVEQPGSNHTENASASVPRSSGPTVVASTDTVSAKIPESTAQLFGDLGFERRQDASQLTSVQSGPSVVLSSSPALSSSSASAGARPTVVSFPTINNGPPLLQIGRYNCTSMMRLELLTGILEDFLDVTATTTGASLMFLELNVHAASSILDPNSPASTIPQDQTPESSQLLSVVMKGNLSDETFTPARLQDERGNLNTSWYNVEWANTPVDGYYDVLHNSERNRYTHNGWPTEAYIAFKKYYRLSIGYGLIDEQMRFYQYGPDLDFIFPPGTFTELQTPSVGTDGRVSSGCLFDTGDTTVTRERNSSWAITTAPRLDISRTPNLDLPIPAITNLTSCGISPILNQTLAGTTANKNPLPYAAFVRSTIWSWAPGQPFNATNSAGDNGNRCVVMSTSPHPGRWRVADCSDRFRVACHFPPQPYNWTIAPQSASYDAAADACPSPYVFGVPHTALENAHLLAALRATRNDEPVFIDLNSRNVEDCWVSGKNGTCPYLTNDAANRARIVVVPTVAAVIIFVLAAFTFFVKCAANRRENKRGRRRRMVGGWEYEGVPS
ncbi:hypothetical protein CC86DRAFT_336388, partial [Ophiobolus disseminans]